MVYVAFFPVVILAYKIPRLLLRTHSWIVAMVIANVAMSVFRRFRRRVVAVAVFAVSATLIAVINSGFILYVCGSVMLVLLVLAVAGTLHSAVKPLSFVETQQKLLRRATTGSNFISSVVDLDEELRSADVQTYSKEQLEKFRTKVSSSVVILKMIGYYSFRLERYRRSRAVVFIGLSSYIGFFWRFRPF